MIVRVGTVPERKGFCILAVRKFGREQKKSDEAGRGGGEDRLLPLSSPPPIQFCSRANLRAARM